MIDLSPLPQGIEADSDTFRNILSTAFVILGAVAVLIITMAGLMYAVSHGDPKVIKQAKDTIFYAVIGLIVSISAYAIVNFVLVNL